ncbi:hypothetical protein MMC07_004040, partial [Pseudocyphellaria aurata]|nr:hypothetical protein [Pseudocyphellaria aurata]
MSGASDARIAVLEPAVSADKSASPYLADPNDVQVAALTQCVHELERADPNSKRLVEAQRVPELERADPNSELQRADPNSKRPSKHIASPISPRVAAILPQPRRANPASPNTHPSSTTQARCPV